MQGAFSLSSPFIVVECVFHTIVPIVFGLRTRHRVRKRKRLELRRLGRRAVARERQSLDQLASGGDEKWQKDEKQVREDERNEVNVIFFKNVEFRVCSGVGTLATPSTQAGVASKN